LIFSFRDDALAAESWVISFVADAFKNYPDFYRLFVRNVESLSQAVFCVRLAGGKKLK